MRKKFGIFNQASHEVYGRTSTSNFLKLAIAAIKPFISLEQAFWLTTRIPQFYVVVDPSQRKAYWKIWQGIKLKSELVQTQSYTMSIILNRFIKEINFNYNLIIISASK